MSNVFQSDSEPSNEKGKNLLVRLHQRISMAKILEAQKHENEKSNNNILNLLGIGIVSHFRLIEYMIAIFFVISLLMIPVIKIYSGYDAMKGTKNEGSTMYTLGNFGFASSE